MALFVRRHAGTASQLSMLLEGAVGDRAIVWAQNPFVLGDHSEPRLDIALLCPGLRFTNPRIRSRLTFCPSWKWP
jgi:hypothetical protein